MANSTPDPQHLAAALDDALRPLVDAANPPGLAWGVDIHGTRCAGALGYLDLEGATPVETGSIFRISSMTKPVTAAAALSLIEAGVLRLDEPVDRLLPELSHPRVLTHPGAALTDTEPAHRSITLEDLLTFRLGHGMDFSSFGQSTPLDERLEQLGLGVGPPAPQGHLPADEWLARLGSVPLRHQPGARWLYNTGSEVLGVLLSRACGASLGEVLRERVLDPLGMRDTGFVVPAESMDRFGPCFVPAAPQPPEPGSGRAAQREVFDPADGQWSRPAAFEGGEGGLVSTVGDYLAFARMLRSGGVHEDTRVLAQASVAAMTRNHLSAEQLHAGGPSDDGHTGWGLGLAVALADPGDSEVASYGWEGGLGSSWHNDLPRGLAAVVLTNQLWSSPSGSPVRDTFWSVLAREVPVPDQRP